MAIDDSLIAPGAPYRVEGGSAALVTEMEANAEHWDVTEKGRMLTNRPSLLVAALFKADQACLGAALSEAVARRVTALAWPTDRASTAVTGAERRDAVSPLESPWMISATCSSS